MNLLTACLLSTRKQSIHYIYEDVLMCFSSVKCRRYQIAVTEESPDRYALQIFRITPVEGGKGMATEQHIAEKPHVTQHFTSEQLKEFLTQHTINLNEWEPAEREDSVNV